ncbi:MauE/DoxX family redox-associated membrane protein [Oceanibacterium hippocampi]|uniref:Methylamine utilization protein MauE n=1 Tax=Oceanibacterium hippocampi TaxID=745714 RepID=A0A1Y5RUJ5_9PROT|nr:MauE/DoxX family redox-associated membrane protein [Oceanibacterium hippocampi]SLN25420.1 Hybrid peroxiredoxin hyPrx5 [Oceanibacterium hippocampi]
MSTSASSALTTREEAALYRMVTAEHICPFGLKARHLLRRKGYDVEDHPLESRAEADAFMAQHDVETTPQVFIGGERIGGYDALRRHFGLASEQGEGTSYQPVLAVFAVAALMALATSWSQFGALLTVRTGEWFIAFSMAVLATLKLRDLVAFSNQFLGYDLVAQRWPPYACLYPFGEALAAILMIAGALIWIAAPVAFVVGSIGAVSVFKAVYIDRRELKCACVGGNSNVPLGAVSLTENLMMVAMAVWMTVS